MAQRTVALCNGKYIGIETIYTVIDEKKVISFCEFYQDSIEVETVDELLRIVYNSMKVSDMIEKLTDKDVWIY